MLELLKYTLSGFWVFIGSYLLIAMILHFLVNGIIKMLSQVFNSANVSSSLPGYVKIEDECYIEDCFDNDDKPIDGRFTEIYLKIEEVKNGGKPRK